MGRWIDSVVGLEVKVTGDFRPTSLAMTQTELERVLEQRGAIVVTHIRRTTDLLVRADSALWKYGEFGDREAELGAHRKRGGHGVVIEVGDVPALLDGVAVWARDPLTPHPESP